MDDYTRLPAAPDCEYVRAARAGVVTALKAEAIGRAAVLLGAGRDRIDATIDPGVGLIVLTPVGTTVKQGDPLLEVHHRGGSGLADARRLLDPAIEVGDAPRERRPLILDRIQKRSA